jgi:hypothetical protein
LTGLVVDHDFIRTNIGFFAAASRNGPMRVTVTLLGDDGSPLGSRSFDIPAGAMLQAQVSARNLTAASFDSGSARVSIVSGDGIATSYASVVVSGSSEGIFIVGVGGVLPPLPAAAFLRGLRRCRPPSARP